MSDPDYLQDHDDWAAVAAAGLRSLIDPDSGRINNWDAP